MGWKVLVAKWDGRFSSQMRHGLSVLGYQINPFSRPSIFCRRWDEKEGKLYYSDGWDKPIKHQSKFNKALISLANIYAKRIII